MIDETETETPKRRGGWPKGKPRRPASAAAAPTTKPMLAKMRARPNWDDSTIDDVGHEGTQDRLQIPHELVESLARDGVALQWITGSIRGQEAKQELATYTRGGWTPVHGSDFDGVFNGMFLGAGADDVVTVEDCMLVARPMSLHEKAKKKEAALAMGPVKLQEYAVKEGIPVSGGNHPSAVRGNKINRTRERIEVPNDEQ